MEVKKKDFVEETQTTTTLFCHLLSVCYCHFNRYMLRVQVEMSPTWSLVTNFNFQ